MGMFNYVNFKDTCKCGGELTSFQTKDDTNTELWCGLVEPRTVDEFYTPCHSCDLWYDYKVSKDKNKVVRLVKFQSIDLTEIPL